MNNKNEKSPKYDLVIDKGRIFTVVVVLVIMALFFIFMLYLGEVL